MCTSLTCLQRKKPLVSATQNGQLEITLHAWPPYGMVNLDIFSCEPFDVDDVARFACEKFQTQDIEIHAVERATRSPRVVYAARDVLVGGGTGELVEGGTGDHKGRPYYTLLM